MDFIGSNNEGLRYRIYGRTTWAILYRGKLLVNRFVHQVEFIQVMFDFIFDVNYRLFSYFYGNRSFQSMKDVMGMGFGK